MKLGITILITSCIVAFICFISCTNESSNPVTRVFEVTDFNKITAGDDHEIIITRGTSFSVQAKGDASDLDDIRMLVSDGVLKIDYPYYDNYRKRVHITITMPELSAVEFSGNTYGDISGFLQPVSFYVNLSGSANFNITANTALINSVISDNSRLSVNGTAASIVTNISGQARYNGYGLAGTDNAIVKAGGLAKMYVNVDKVFTADASGQSNIYYKGNPMTKNIIQAGRSRVTNE